MYRMILFFLAAALLPAASPAQVRIGLLVSATGPTAAIGVPQKNTGDILPRRIGDATVEYFQLEDGADSTRAVQNARKLLLEHNVDAVIGPSTTPAALAILDIVAEGKVPLLATVGSSNVVEPLDAKRRWVFKTTQNDDLIASALIRHMKSAGVRTLGFIGFNDPYGENWHRVLVPMAGKEGIRVVANERYARTDQSVTGQSLKLIAAKPDAILIGAAGTPGATPQKELVARGYKGKIYQTHGVANPDFLRVVGADGNGTLLPAGPMLVFEQLPDSNPVKKVAAEYVTQYEKKFGTRSTFGGHAYDAYLLLNGAIPGALKKGKPGTKEFRAALRDELEKANVVGTHGVFVMTPHDHNGLDNRARVMVRIDNGKWVLVK